MLPKIFCPSPFGVYLVIKKKRLKKEIWKSCRNGGKHCHFVSGSLSCHGQGQHGRAKWQRAQPLFVSQSLSVMLWTRPACSCKSVHYARSQPFSALHWLRAHQHGCRILRCLPLLHKCWQLVSSWMLTAYQRLVHQKQQDGREAQQQIVMAL